MNTQQKAESLVNQLIGESDLLGSVISGDPFGEHGIDFLNKLASWMSNDADTLAEKWFEIDDLEAPPFLQKQFSHLLSVLEDVMYEARPDLFNFNDGDKDPDPPQYVNPARIEREMAHLFNARVALAREAHKKFGDLRSIGILASDVLDANEGLEFLNRQQ